MAAPQSAGPTFADVVSRLERLEARATESTNIDVTKLIY